MLGELRHGVLVPNHYGGGGGGRYGGNNDTWQWRHW